MKQRYARAKHRSERSALIDEAITMTSFSRKYVIRLLCGSRVYKKHHSRAPTYSKEARNRLVKICFAFGQMCSRYLHSIIEKAIADYQEARPNVYFSPEVVRELLQMSPSTMARILRPHQFQMRLLINVPGIKLRLQQEFLLHLERYTRKRALSSFKLTRWHSVGAICAKVSFGSYTSLKLRRSGVCVHLFGIVAQRQHVRL